MRGVNKVIVVGTLGKDPEAREANGTTICRFSLAVNESYTDKATQEKKEHTEWINVTTFGRTAEVAAKYLHKASKVYIEGKMQTRKWIDKDGKDKWSTDVVAHELQMLDSKQQDDARPSRKAHEDAPGAPARTKADEQFEDDDIPF